MPLMIIMLLAALLIMDLAAAWKTTAALASMPDTFSKPLKHPGIAWLAAELGITLNNPHEANLLNLEYTGTIFDTI